MSVMVSTPSRLHFGLLRFEQQEGPSFGGLGMMIAAPRCVVEISAAEQWSADGPGCDRALDMARQVLGRIEGKNKPLALHVRVRQVIPAHHGLGGGTQMALAVAAGIREVLGLPPGTADELAAITGRGQRSAVGAHGFVHGGLIWETGRRRGEFLGQLAERLPIPSQWRIVLVRRRQDEGLNGLSEAEAFQRLPPVPEITSARLRQLVEEQILPAVRSSNAKAASEALYEYGRLSGECFAPVQGGPFASAEIATCVSTIRRLGVAGVGQSSWGPTVYALTESVEQAESLIKQLSRRLGQPVELQITAADNVCAQITRD